MYLIMKLVQSVLLLLWPPWSAAAEKVVMDVWSRACWGIFVLMPERFNLHSVRPSRTPPVLLKERFIICTKSMSRNHNIHTHHHHRNRPNSRTLFHVYILCTPLALHCCAPYHLISSYRQPGYQLHSKRLIVIYETGNSTPT